MPRYLQCSTIGISNSLRKNEGCLILIALLLKHKVNDLEPLYNTLKINAGYRGLMLVKFVFT